jgi:deoxyribonuclease V
VPKLHKWDLSYVEARAVQTRLARQVRFEPLRREPQIVAGLDCAFTDGGKRIVAAVVVLRRVRASTAKESDVVQKRRHPQAALEAATQVSFELIETASASLDVTFPYIPGLLSFREAPACLAAVAKLESRPDLFLVDGQGVAHPRRLGLAAHLGLFLDRPTIGCAKSRLIGTFDEPGTAKGAHSLLYDGDEVIGAVVRTRTKVKPLFVSVGHRCTLDDAIALTLACTTKYRLPEPTRLAHQTVSGLKH